MVRRLRVEDRGRIAEKVMDVGNLILAGSVIGQVLVIDFKPVVAISGLIAFGLTYFVAYRIMTRR